MARHQSELCSVYIIKYAKADSILFDCFNKSNFHLLFSFFLALLPAPQFHLGKYHFNSLLRHWLDRFQYFGNYLCFAEPFVSHHISLRTALFQERLVSNDVLVKFVQIAIDSCCAIQDRLNLERKPVCVQQLISAIEQTLGSIGMVILLQIERSVRGSGSDQESKGETDHKLARILLEELLNRCPVISAPSCGYASPVINSFFKGWYKPILFLRLTAQCLKNYNKLMKMIVELRYDLNTVDHRGNTILHIMMSDILYEINKFQSCNGVDATQQLVDSVVDCVRILLKNGSYPNTRNKRGKLPGEGLEDVKLHTFNPENIIVRFKNLLTEYDCSLTLKYLAATKIIDSKIPNKNHLPRAMVKFVDLH